MAALEEMDAVGETEFSLRKVAMRVGCDPMAVIYHLGSREGLERAVADMLSGQVSLPSADTHWRDRLTRIADSYRHVALLHPRSFPLLQRFWTTGASDYVILEAIYSSFADAGIPLEKLMDYGVFYLSSVIGFCTAEARGMLSLEMPAVTASEVKLLDGNMFPTVTRLLALEQNPDDKLWQRSREMMLDGIEVQIDSDAKARRS
jgi:AcrR family transcriptional regulator